jgi:C-terminal processing protease CtpA/Prc
MFPACRPMVELEAPESFGDVNDRVVNFSRTFEGFWEGMNHNYLFWEQERNELRTNWDQVYRKYRPLFAELGTADMSNNADKDKFTTAYAYFKEMTANLVDSHTTISFNQNIAALGMLARDQLPTIRPAMDRAYRRMKNRAQEMLFFQVPDMGGSDWSGDNPIDLASYNYMKNVIFENYVKDDLGGVVQRNWGTRMTGGQIRAAVGRIPLSTAPGYVLYFYFSRFGLIENLDEFFSGNGSTSTPIVNDFFDALTADDPDMKGVIIDIRGNQGGNAIDINFISGPLVDRNIVFAYARSKTGEGRRDYSPEIPLTIAAYSPENRIKNIGLPVVLLIDKMSLSCSEITAMAFREMKSRGYNRHVIGETAYGATAPVLDTWETLNGGSFKVPPFIAQVKIAAFNVRSSDGNVYEGHGVPPHQFAFDGEKETEIYWELFLKPAPSERRDLRLEAAIDYIKGH